MLTAILLSIGTGLCWTLIGIALSKSADDNFDVRTYGMLQTGITAVILLFILVNFSECTLQNTLILAGLILTGGFCNSMAQYSVKYLMAKGHHGPIWTIAHAAIIFPFLYGVVCWGDAGTWPQWLGTFFITAGVLAIAKGQAASMIKPSDQTTQNSTKPSVLRFNWQILIPFFIVAFNQILFATPSRLEGILENFNDNGNLRPFFTSFGGTLGWIAIRGTQRRKPLAFSKKILFFATLIGLSQTVSLFIFYESLDQMTGCGLGNACVPFIVGANIGAFALYRFFCCHERINLFEKIGVAVIFAGMASIALSCWL